MVQTDIGVVELVMPHGANDTNVIGWVDVDSVVERPPSWYLNAMLMMWVGLLETDARAELTGEVVGYTCVLATRKDLDRADS